MHPFFVVALQMSKILSRKFVVLYKLCEDLLSKSKHYDWKLRAIKTTLYVAGGMKRSAPDLTEDKVRLSRAMALSRQCQTSKHACVYQRGRFRPMARVVMTCRHVRARVHPLRQNCHVMINTKLAAPLSAFLKVPHAVAVTAAGAAACPARLQLGQADQRRHLHLPGPAQ
jgi:hypothetical protein